MKNKTKYFLSAKTIGKPSEPMLISQGGSSY